MKYRYFFFILVFLTSSSFGQKRIPSNKQYVIVKSTFDFLKQIDRYKANSFTKFLFSKAGYVVYLDNEELPEELYYNKCSAMYVDVKDKSNLFATRNYIELIDCNGKLLYTSILKGLTDNRLEMLFLQLKIYKKFMILSLYKQLKKRNKNQRQLK
jgi:hypothetical protein